MNSCNTVDSVAANDRQVRHVDSLLRRFLDQRHSADPIRVARPALANRLQREIPYSLVYVYMYMLLSFVHIDFLYLITPQSPGKHPL